MVLRKHGDDSMSDLAASIMRADGAHLSRDFANDAA